MADKLDPALREVFRLAYLFRLKYSNPTGTEQFWRNASQEMGMRVKELDNHPFAMAIFTACYADIEREYLEQAPAPEQTLIL